jgi:hypothetical protein
MDSTLLSVFQPLPAVAEGDSLPTGTHRLLGPRYGDGKLWFRAPDVATGADGAPGGAEHIAMIDAAIAAKIRAFLDSAPPDSFAYAGTPRWTTTIKGKPWGFDGKWIYLGGLKIPSAILALIPLPVSGNYEQSQRAAALEQMRQDIVQAAWRAQNAKDFKRYVGEIRQRKDQERDAAIRNAAPRDTLTP